MAEKNFIITTGEWAPWTGKNLPGKGLANDAVMEVFKKMGQKVTIKFYPWKRAMSMASNGKKTEGTCCWNTVNEEREKIFYFTEPIFINEYYFWSLKNNQFFNKTIDELRGKEIRIVQLRGYVLGDEFESLKTEKDVTLTTVNSAEEAIKMIKKGWADIFYEEKLACQKILNEMKEKGDVSEEEFKNIQAFQMPFYKQPLQLFLNKKLVTKKFVEEYNKTVKELGIIKKYSKRLKEGYYQ